MYAKQVVVTSFLNGVTAVPVFVVLRANMGNMYCQCMQHDQNPDVEEFMMSVPCCLFFAVCI